MVQPLAAEGEHGAEAVGEATTCRWRMPSRQPVAATTRPWAATCRWRQPSRQLWVATTRPCAAATRPCTASATRPTSSPRMTRPRSGTRGALPRTT
eukprot:4840352-Pyramimonas_sp.AAC.1